MTLRGTIALIILAIGLIGWFLFFQSDQRQKPDEPLFHADPNKITLITITDGNEVHSLRRTTIGWQVGLTPPDRADATEIARLLTAIQEIKPVDILNPRELKKQLSLSSLGLENPKRSLTIHQDGLKDQTLYFGNEAVGAQRFFARLEKKNNVFIIPSTLSEIAFRSSDDFRDHHLTSLQFQDLDQIKLQQGLGEFRALFKNDRWMMAQPTKASLNTQAVAAWIEPLLRAPVEARLDNDEGDLSISGLDHPRAEIRLFSKDSSTPIILSLGKQIEEKEHPAKKFVYLRSSERHSIFQMSADIEKFFMISPDELRNHQFFQLNLDTVDQIIINKGTDTLSFRRQHNAADNWISDGEYSVIIPGAKMREMLDVLEKTTVISFQPATAENMHAAALEPVLNARATIRFIAHLSENTPDEEAGDFVVLKIIFGDGLKQMSSTIFAHLDDLPDILEIPASVMELPIWKLGVKE